MGWQSWAILIIIGIVFVGFVCFVLKINPLKLLIDIIEEILD